MIKYSTIFLKATAVENPVFMDANGNDLPKTVIDASIALDVKREASRTILSMMRRIVHCMLITRNWRMLKK